MVKKLFLGIFIVFAISIFFIFSKTDDENIFIGESEHWTAKFVTTEERSELEIKYKDSKKVFDQKFDCSYEFIDGKDAVVIVNGEVLEAGREKTIKIQRSGLYSNRESSYKVIISWNGNEETINLKKK
ncbi:hypothetical protein Semix9P1_phi42 [Clostridioides phage phiSemix9P1]|uniref:hypothetical protein n=1 Tax=unclassified Clostridioides TaxID=2635829 RepID=UPI0009C36B83|nr:hypothetical protein Semix9P1_phi42 [Clostridioides phage phiSemix9P1]MCC0642093.1 hypothetical protein [Clostridioides sp. ES-S-0049-03]MCC0646139.1 hypothetical protein [Clostridioides sp. ZZV14-6150]MCC0678153.1 hypothetical protein [Clostridioides sp. ES-W-0018-02]MCC0712943.1 hypothetical protein [Clostridioides sp. ES-W-0017-02]MCC0718351.1 hypothetical protein [Clostridioides sp. ZZV14-6105]MCC0723958.1 hypothetical protein [Clostridioides sp. ZZV14-6104]MCC0724838.1 hypothetical p